MPLFNHEREELVLKLIALYKQTHDGHGPTPWEAWKPLMCLIELNRVCKLPFFAAYMPTGKIDPLHPSDAFLSDLFRLLGEDLIVLEKNWQIDLTLKGAVAAAQIMLDDDDFLFFRLISESP